MRTRNGTRPVVTMHNYLAVFNLYCIVYFEYQNLCISIKKIYL